MYANRIKGRAQPEIELSLELTSIGFRSQDSLKMDEISSISKCGDPTRSEVPRSELDSGPYDAAGTAGPPAPLGGHGTPANAGVSLSTGDEGRKRLRSAGAIYMKFLKKIKNICFLIVNNLPILN